jgi:glycosyltransferase involved in cell wall biosynthesis
MKILIYVNKFDQEADLLGFFVGWVNQLAPYFERITIVTKYIGKYIVPDNVRVVSITNNLHAGKLKSAFTYMSLLFRMRADYDLVFVIMAPTWVILSGLPAKLFGKKLYLWYAVWRGSWKLKIAQVLADRIFTSVPEAYPFKSDKVLVVGQGINTNLFRPDPTKRVMGKILLLGRISSVKKIEVFLQAIAELKNNSGELYNRISIEIAGAGSSVRDLSYIAMLKGLAKKLEISDRITWLGKISHNDTVSLFQGADVFVNLTAAGSFDKAMLEAMASGAVMFTSNPALKKFLTPEIVEKIMFNEDDHSMLSEKIITFLASDGEGNDNLRAQLREIIVKKHSQEQWAQNIVSNLIK